MTERPKPGEFFEVGGDTLYLVVAVVQDRQCLPDHKRYIRRSRCDIAYELCLSGVNWYNHWHRDP